MFNAESGGVGVNIENSNVVHAEPFFTTPQDEIDYLRKQVQEKTVASEHMPRKFTQEEHAVSALREHAEQPVENFANIEGDSAIHLRQIATKVQAITGMPEDKHVVELASIMFEKGVRFAMEVAAQTQSPALEDGFHAFLVQYLLSGYNNDENKISKSEWKALHLKLFEIVPPPSNGDDKQDAKHVIALMEQMYAALQSVARDSENKDNDYYSLEIAISNGGNEVTMYIAVPAHVEAILEKTLQGYFPGIEVRPHTRDYNIFHSSGYNLGTTALETSDAVIPFKTYKDLEGDPISVIMNAFTKLQKEGEGAAMQILVKPAGDKLRTRFSKILESMQNGDNFETALKRQSFWKSLFIADKNKKDSEGKEIEIKDEDKKKHLDNEYEKGIANKLSSTIVDTNIILMASAKNKDRAEMILSDMKASFMQYTDVNGNSIKWRDIDGKHLTQLTHNFTYRLWNDDIAIPLNLSELATLYHVPSYVKDFTQMKTATMNIAPAPLDLPQSGTLLGLNSFRSTNTKIFMTDEDRMRHMYVIGQTGTGKTTILKNMIVQDILDGKGCCFIDPHGSDLEDIMACIPPERYDDVIYFDPSHTDRPMGLNMMEFDRERPETKTFVVNEMLSIFNKLFDMKTSGGPGFEQYFRNSALLVMEHPESGNTILEISRVLSDKDFRDYKLSKCKNPLILQFWKNAEATTGEQGLSNWVPYINSKFDNFLSNDIMRPIIAQEKSAFNLREIMDTKKIFLVNLSKGRLGDINAYLIGLILVGKFLQAALARVDSQERPDFFLYIDEFQNVTTPSIAAILSEARKYRLSLNLAHQYIAQLPEDIKGAVFGNVGSMAVFRVGPDDAAYLEKQFTPTFSASDLMRVENYNCYLKLLSQNKPQKPFSMATYPTPRGDKSKLKDLQDLSYMKYGRPREEVESEIMSKYQL